MKRYFVEKIKTAYRDNFHVPDRCEKEFRGIGEEMETEMGKSTLSDDHFKTLKDMIDDYRRRLQNGI